MSEGFVLIVEDDGSLREALCETLEAAGYEVTGVDHASAALTVMQERAPGVVISDLKMDGMDGRSLLQRIKGVWPETPVLLMTAYGTIQDAVGAIQEGAADYLVKPFEAQTVLDAVAKYARKETEYKSGFVAEDPRTRQLANLAARVANTDATVMILGESGTGKEVLARHIHSLSARHEQPFVAINCAAIPENMLEAVLFGYEKGAFTGAHQAHPGKFEQAQGGTLLLDEVSEMDLALQAKLLRVLQEREVERLGARKAISLDVRVLATSNRNLREAVDEGRFREDLYYRLNVFPVHLPPLRERPDDILPLAESFLAQHRRPDEPRCHLSDDAEERLMSYAWPGNVRELENVIQRALILQNGESIDADAIHFEDPGSEQRSWAVANDRPLERDLKTREQELILEALQAGGSRKAAAERLGISPRTLRYKLARLREAGIDLPSSFDAQSA